MPLPKSKSEPKVDPGAFSMLLYGQVKVGKTEFASKFPDAFFMATEPGQKFVSVYKDDVTSWKQALEDVKEIAAGKHQFKTIVIDTIDNLYKLCSEHVCKELNIKHESELGFGKGFSMVNSEFQRVLTRLSMCPYGLILISHSQEKEMDTRTGKIKKVVPTLPDSARKIVMGMVDMILYCEFEAEKDEKGRFIKHNRVMRTKPHSTYEAGDRSRKLPETLSLDYEEFMKFFMGKND